MKHLFIILFTLLFCFACTDIKDELEKDQINQVFGNEKGTLVELSNGVKVLKNGDQYVFESDILLTSEQVENIGSKSELRSTITTEIAKKWSNNTVYYTIHPSLSSTNQGYVKDAIRSWDQNTNISFIPRTTEVDYVEFVQGPMGVTMSAIGKTGGRQEIILGNPFPGTVIHEIGHTIGLYHEHTRPDRDNYITVKKENIMDGHEIDFALAPLNSNHGPFDFSSIMLYDSYLFSKNGATMVKKDGNTFSSQNYSLSVGDIAGVNYMYPPNYNLSTTKTNLEASAGGGNYSITFTSAKNITNWQLVSVSSFPSWIKSPVVRQKNKCEGEISFTVSPTTINQVGEIILMQNQSNKQLKLTVTTVPAPLELAILVGSTQPNQTTAWFDMKVDGQTVKSRTWMPLKNSRTVIDYIPNTFSELSDVTILLTFPSIIKGFTAYGFTISSGGAGYSNVELKGKFKSLNQANIGVVQL